MIKVEAKFTIKFRDWLYYQKKFQPSAFEIKATTKKSIRLADVKVHQLEALKVVKHGRFYYKIPDDAYAQKPFDCFTLRGSAYIVLAFVKPRQLTYFYVIDIDDYISICTKIKRKSWNEETLNKFTEAVRHSM